MTQIEDRHLFVACTTKLQALAKKHYPEQGRFKELYLTAVDCIRTYLKLQYGLDMKEYTTQELERILHRLRGPSALIQGLRKIFAEHEKVELGEWLPSIQQAHEIPERAQKLLTMLAPPEARQSHS